MCDAETTAQLGLLFQTGAGVAGAAASYDKAKIERAVNESNAEFAERQAQDALTRGGRAEVVLRNRAARLKGAQKAKLAGGNVQLQGSALDVLEETDAMADADAEVIRANAQGEAAGRRAEAAGYRARANGISPGMAAGTSLLSSAGQVADRWYAYQERWGE